MTPRVLFVSKPVVPPFHDGTKCLVRDVASELRRYEPVVMGTAAAPTIARPDGLAPLAPVPVYGGSGAYAPALRENARAAAWLFLRSRADVWHFVFAPNPRTSAVGRAARSVRRKPVLQTIASPPREFAPELFFGDVVVAQSRSTRDAVVAAFRAAHREPPDVRVIPPPVGSHLPPSDDAIARVKRALALPEGVPVFVYPGDLEVSRGAETVAQAVPELAARVKGAVVVFACRPKTKDAPRIAAALEARLDPASVRFSGEIDLRALLACATGVLFPVDDLRGKVDLPISLLEALQLGCPVVVAPEGPLADLEGALAVPSGDPGALARVAARLAEEPVFRETEGRRGRAAVAGLYAAHVVAAAYERAYDDLLAARRRRR